MRFPPVKQPLPDWVGELECPGISVVRDVCCEEAAEVLRHPFTVPAPVNCSTVSATDPIHRRTLALRRIWAIQ